ncbi:MAG: xanthine dehydrogenase [Firmicutes bacterium]|nr:xanthine dehydrogenase [Bacillota bacterium]
MKKFYQDLLRLLAAGENIVLATIFHSSGSSPRSEGAKMAVCLDGSIIGSVGGGRLEAETIRLAKQVHISQQAIIQDFDLTGKDAAGLGMICGGSGKIFVDYIPADDLGKQTVYEAVLFTMETAQKAWLITELKLEEKRAESSQQCLVLQDGTIVGSFQSDPDFIGKLSSEAVKISIHADERDGKHYLVEPIRNAGTVYLFGAGHVSQQVARLTNMVGFKTVVVDDRPDFANHDRFPEAMVVIVDDFRFLPELNIGSDSYVVIVTRGHLHDGIVLEQMLLTGAVYIGMIGSKRKRDALYQELKKKGFHTETLQQVHSPIGIDIDAETPEEIAVSIVAELIKARVECEKWLTMGK